MTNKQTGGPAFPATEEHGCNSGWSGMDLRDYFAAKAMQGMYAAHKFPSGIIIDTAKEAYEMADAMLKAREE